MHDINSHCRQAAKYLGSLNCTVPGEGEWLRLGEFEFGEVVAICDHLGYLVLRQLKHDLSPRERGDGLLLQDLLHGCVVVDQQLGGAGAVMLLALSVSLPLPRVSKVKVTMQPFCAIAPSNKKGWLLTRQPNSSLPPFGKLRTGPASPERESMHALDSRLRGNDGSLTQLIGLFNKGKSKR